jgi:hypothetical protein
MSYRDGLTSLEHDVAGMIYNGVLSEWVEGSDIEQALAAFFEPRQLARDVVQRVTRERADEIERLTRECDDLRSRLNRRMA